MIDLFVNILVVPMSLSQLSYLNMAGIDLFVKILGKGRRKEGKFQSLEVRAQAHRS